MLKCFTLEGLHLGSNGKKADPEILVVRQGNLFMIEIGQPGSEKSIPVRLLGTDDFAIFKASGLYGIKEASILGSSGNFVLIPPTVIDGRSRALVKISLRAGLGGRVSSLVWMTEFGIVVLSAVSGEVGEYLLVIPNHQFASIDVTDREEIQWRYIFAFRDETGVSVAVNCNAPQVGIPNS